MECNVVSIDHVRCVVVALLSSRRSKNDHPDAPAAFPAQGTDSRQRRGSSDRLSPNDLNILARDISSYIVKAQQEGKHLWKFGAYGEESPKHAATRSKAPFTPDLLVNFDLLVDYHQVL
jgi:hypothetical protein